MGMENLILQIVSKVLSEQREPSIPIIVKLFKMLNEEKKKNKTRTSLIQVIERYVPYMNIPSEYALYLLELYLLNYRKDGDYSSLTKENFVDPRKQKGKTTSNPKAKLYTIAQLPFKGSNLEGYWSEDRNGKPYYKVVSYGWYPVYIFKDDKWYEVTETYSSSTSKQMSNANPVNWNDYLENQVYALTPDEMKMLERGNSHEEVMKSKLKKLKSIEPEVSKRKKIVRSWGGYQHNTPQINIKFKINSIDLDGDKAIVTVDVYDVVKRVNGKGVDTPENYLKGELPNITTNTVENQIISKMRGELKDYVGTRFRYTDEIPPDTKIDFKFNHLKK